MTSYFESIFIRSDHSQILFRILLELDFEDASKIPALNRSFGNLFFNSNLLSKALEALFNVGKAFWRPTLLHCACEIGYLPIVKHAVIEKRLPVDDDGNGIPPLLLAVSGGNLDVVRFLLDSGADSEASFKLNRRRNIKESPFYVKNFDLFPQEWFALNLAAFKGHSEMTEFLLRRGNSKFEAAVLSAVFCAIKHPEILESLLETMNGESLTYDKVREGEKRNYTPLFCLMEDFDPSSVDLLIKSGVDINFAMDRVQWKPLQQTALHHIAKFAGRLFRDMNLKWGLQWIPLKKTTDKETNRFKRPLFKGQNFY